MEGKGHGATSSAGWSMFSAKSSEQGSEGATIGGTWCEPGHQASRS